MYFLLHYAESYLPVFCYTLLFMRTQVICLKCNIFSRNFAHVFYLTVPTKGFHDFFILFRSWVINKSGFREFAETKFFVIYGNISRSKIKKILHTLLYTLIIRICVQILAKIFNSAVVTACQSFQFSRQNTWFLKK